MTTPIPGYQPLPPEQELAAQMAAAGAGSTGQTETDIGALITQMQAQLDQQATDLAALKAQQGPQGENPLIATARALRSHLRDFEGHDSHAPVIGLADDLVEAAANAVESGNLDPVTNIAARLAKWADRHPVPPGESYHARNADQVIRYHLPDAVDGFVPAPRKAAVSGAKPVQVTAGSVVG